MPERLLTSDYYVAVLAMFAAIWGGIVSYVRRILSGERYSSFAAGAHILTAGFAGLLAALGCLHADVPLYLAGVTSGIAGHMGAEFIRLLELRFIKK
jgi:hypothetical protein